MDRPLPVARPLALAALAATLVVVGCARHDARDAASAPRPLRVVATTGMVADIARGIGGDLVRVRALMGPGVDPHLFKASEGDVLRLQEADLVLYNGLHLEARLAHVFARMGGRIRAVAVAEAVPAARRLFAPGRERAPDPHVWFDVALWRLAAGRALDALAAADSVHAGAYRANAERYLASLDSLDAYVREQAGRVPPARRVLVTAHDAFNYFGHAYGFEVRGLQGFNTAAEAGTADVQELASFIARRRLPAIFAESSVSPRAVQAVRAAVRARGLDVALGGQLFSDSLGPEASPAGSYAGMVRHNIDTIVAALLHEPLAAQGEP